MKYSLTAVAVAALAIPTAFAAPAIQKRAACTSPVKLTGNAFTTNKLYANDFYAAEVKAAVGNLTDPSLATAAAKVGAIGTFMWMDTIAKLASIPAMIEAVPCGDIIGLVVYDLPGRDCAAKASNGELAVGDIDKYKTDYIDVIKAMIVANPNTAIALIIEPDSLPNLVTNDALATCQASADGYVAGVTYALQELNLPNVVMYLDAGHGGWLGWTANLAPGAKQLADVWKAAGSPAQLQGISTNVAGWNAFIDVPGEFANATDGQYNKAQDEQRYVALIGAELATNGMPNHAIVDTGRNAVQGLRLAWGDWCNVEGAGFGAQPTSDTGDDLVDAFVWVKPGGESDGTSDSTADRYDSFCGLADAFKPSPQAGTWNQAYFEALVKNAKPAL